MGGVCVTGCDNCGHEGVESDTDMGHLAGHPIEFRGKGRRRGRRPAAQNIQTMHKDLRRWLDAASLVLGHQALGSPDLLSEKPLCQPTLDAGLADKFGGREGSRHSRGAC